MASLHLCAALRAERGEPLDGRLTREEAEPLERLPDHHRPKRRPLLSPEVHAARQSKGAMCRGDWRHKKQVLLVKLLRLNRCIRKYLGLNISIVNHCHIVIMILRNFRRHFFINIIYFFNY